jgi:hypothetical protein
VFLSGEERKGRSGGVEQKDRGRVEDGMAVRSEERRDSDERVR